MITVHIDTKHIIFYRIDGSIEEYDLTNPRQPLPRWRSLVDQRRTELQRASQGSL